MHSFASFYDIIGFCFLVAKSESSNNFLSCSPIQIYIILKVVYYYMCHSEFYLLVYLTTVVITHITNYILPPNFKEARYHYLQMMGGKIFSSSDKKSLEKAPMWAKNAIAESVCRSQRYIDTVISSVRDDKAFWKLVWASVPIH